MVVIGLIGLITAIAIVNFTGSPAQRLDSSLRLLHSQVSLARQHAITHREDTVLVFPNNPADSERFLRSFFVAAGSGTQMTNALGNWVDLPVGIHFDNDAGLEDNLFGLSAGPAITLPEYLDPPASADVLYMRFNPRGEVVTQQRVSPRLYLAVGTVTGSTFSRANDDVRDLVLVRRLTGLPEIHRFDVNP